MRIVIGMRVEFQESYEEPPLPDRNGKVNTIEWPEFHTSHFDIDGPGGEAILYVQVKGQRDQSFVLIQTTRNRV